MRLSGGVVRSILAKEDAHLHELLSHQWEIALDHWLAALSFAQDSFHGYPHQRNVERHLDAVLTDSSVSPSKLRVQLSPAEIYIILSSILFHDIGRAFPERNQLEDPARGKKFDHGEASLRILQANWAMLGIPSREIAEAIGQVSSFHNLEHNDRKSKLRQLQEECVVDPYGTINLRWLAALLFLADHLDSAFTRVLPQYFEPSHGFGAIGAFRKAVQGVRINHSSQMICTVLGVVEALAVDRKQICKYRITDSATLEPLAAQRVDDEKKAKELAKSGTNIKYEKALDDIAWRLEPELSNVLKGGLDACRAALFNASSKPLDTRVACGLLACNPQVAAASFVATDWLVARKQLLVNSYQKEKFGWDPKTVVAMVMGDVMVNDEAIRDIHDVLIEMGMPFRRWLLEHNGRLFDGWGQETCEPVFDHRYMVSLAAGMWELNKHVFGWSRFTYENLADAIQDPDVARVKQAVHRLGRVAEPVEVAQTPQIGIRASPDRWQLVTTGSDWVHWYEQKNGTDNGLNFLNERIGTLAVSSSTY